jgi:RHS repeat-associated protein
MKKIFKNKICFLVITLFFLSTQLNAQLGGTGTVTIIGSSPVNQNESHSYIASFSKGMTVYTANWSTPGGTVTSQNINEATVLWTTAGIHELKYNVTSSNNGVLEATFLVRVEATTVPDPPTTPSILSIDCSGAVLQNTGSIPSGVMWYWQTSWNGESTLYPAINTYTVSNSGTYYLRARNLGGTDVWSSAVGLYVDLNAHGTVWYRDTDGDGKGDPNTTITACNMPAGYVANADDQCPGSNGQGDPNGCPPLASLSDENYIYTFVPQVSVADVSQITQNKDALKNITYFDGLGRPIQSVAIKQSASEKDIVNHIDYDNFGRQALTYLPYQSNSSSGFYRSSAKTETNSYYINNYGADINSSNPNPFSKISYDNSPLGRTIKKAAPGYDWRSGGGHETEVGYDSNAANEVRRFSVIGNTLSLDITINSGYYPAGTLYKIILKNENHDGTSTKNNTIEEFKDQFGRVILNRKHNNSQVHDTYYVYDNKGLLRFVLPPKTESHTNSLSTITSSLNTLCYQYRYDSKQRLTEKRIPGKGWEVIVYDHLNRPVLTQDALQKNQKKWSFTKYDGSGRVAYTGIYTHSTDIDQATMQTYYTNQNTFSPVQGVIVVKTNERKSGTSSYPGTGYDNTYYSNSVFPVSNIEILIINYYDNYTFDRAGTFDPSTASTEYYSAYVGGSSPEDEISIIKKPQGLPTGARIKVLDTNDWVTSVSYYDFKSRPIYTYSYNSHLATTDIEKMKLDFVGKPVKTHQIHTYTNDQLPSIETLNDFTYDHAGRLLTQTKRINSSSKELIVNNTYDELGLLKSKKVGGDVATSIENSLGLQTVDYEYNVRGWLKSINSDTNNDNDLFNFELEYNNPNSGTPLYNGNISQTSWNTLNVDQSVKTYTYSYDALNRITSGILSSSNSNHTDKHNLKLVEYDKNGNISKLRRNGYRSDGNFDQYLDHMTYYYSGNKLTGILEEGHHYEGFADRTHTSTSDYTYDINGNMTKDNNKQIIDIEYNHLNLPTKVKFSSIGVKEIRYTYDANGKKIKKRVIDEVNSLSTTTDYAGNFVYENNTLQFFNHEEGYIKYESGKFEFIYQYLDHLGNVRLSYTDTNSNGTISQNEIIEESNFYPFGMKHKGYNDVITSNGDSNAQKYKYNGVEYEESLGLDLYEMDYRQYDPSIGRFTSIDPVIHFNYSTYQAFDNNPIFWSDPSGANSVSELIDDLWEKTPDDGLVYRYDAQGNQEGDPTDPRKVLKETRENFKKAKKTLGKFKKAFTAVDALYALGDGATHSEKLKALKDVYNSINKLLPRGLSFKVFAQYYDTYLAMVNYHMGIIVEGLKRRNETFAEIASQSTFTEDLGILYPGVYYGGIELYNWLKTLKHGGKEIEAAPNSIIKFLKDNAEILSFITDSRVPFSITSMSSTNFWVLKRFGKSRTNVVRGEATIYVLDNLDSIINIIYGGLKIQKD